MYDNYTTKRIQAAGDAQNGYFKDALECDQIALQAAKNRYGPLHPSIVPVLDDLAAVERSMGHYADSEKDYKWALAIRENAVGADHPLVADSLNHLAALYGDLARDEEAEILEQRALQIMEKAHGGPTSDCAFELLLLGQTQLCLDKYKEASTTLGRCVKFGEEGALTSKPDLYLETLATLAKAEQKTGDFDEAEGSLKEAVEFGVKNEKPDSVETGDAFKRLGDFYRSRGATKKADETYASALKIFKAYAGMNPTYPIAGLLLKAAACYQAVGDKATARKLRQEALGPLQDSLGPDHPLVALCLADLAEDDLAAGDKGAAAKKLGEAVEILKNSLGEGHPLTRDAEKRLQKVSNSH